MLLLDQHCLDASDRQHVEIEHALLRLDREAIEYCYDYNTAHIYALCAGLRLEIDKLSMSGGTLRGRKKAA